MWTDYGSSEYQTLLDVTALRVGMSVAPVKRALRKTIVGALLNLALSTHHDQIVNILSETKT